MYVAAPAAAQQPPRQLKGFAKLHLEPGVTGQASPRLDRDDVLVGRSSRDLRGRAGFEVGVRAPAPR